MCRNYIGGVEMKKYVLFLGLIFGFVFPVFSQNVNINEIRDYAKSRQYAILKIDAKFYARDSSNGDWFDGIRNIGNPTIVIQRTSGQRDVVNATLHNSYRFTATFFNRQNDLVISLDVTLQFLDSLVVNAGNVPYLVESQYDDWSMVNEPSGSYTLRNFAGAFQASDGANLFLRWYENASVSAY